MPPATPPPAPASAPTTPSSPALRALLAGADAATSNFDADAAGELRPLVAAALAEAEAEAAAGAPGAAPVAELAALARALGWDAAAAAFARPLDPRELAARLKAALLTDLALVGEGAYSRVYRARSRLDGSVVTLKKLRLDGGGEGLPVSAVREISLLRELAGCPHVVRLLDVLHDRARVFLVLEHLDRDLADHLRASPAAREPRNVRRYCWQVLCGLAHAHARRVVHRDLKPQNILLDAAANAVKIADLGLARTFLPAGCGARPLTREVVTLLYRAPELLLGATRYAPSVDIWSAGCVLAELASGRPLFAGDSEIGQLHAIFRLLGTPGPAEWPGAAELPEWQPLFPRWAPQDLAPHAPGLGPAGLDLLGRLLRLNPEDRPTAAEALCHPYFDGVLDEAPGGPPPPPI
jgi:serine/threonine protein kinase